MNDDAQAPQASDTPRRSWLRTGLVLSVALNFALVGAIAAPRLMDRFGPRPRPIEGGRFVQLLPVSFIQGLTRDRRAIIRQTIKPWGQHYRALRKDVDLQVDAIAKTLEADPWVPDQTAAAIAAFTGLNQQAIGAGNDTVLEVISLLTPDERLMLAQRLRDRSRSTRGMPKK